jgi:hypothetical protein
MMVGMILAGMLIGGAIALAVPSETEIGIYLRLGVLVIFVLAAGLGLWLVIRILWRGFREERRLERKSVEEVILIHHPT